ncbi:hypothetical protein [Plantactinospora sp. KBS50]|uniref:hypothetical protein n=1 Tax=Plantactinospora sp. KBS50 TaxID=2024580 RepID=UPI000BAAFE4E|nr:hypothetical protein [Plantactinospora sp. KBS50]ASW54983.1 hypothetical protein CIK06_13465 [Plantactinospora sp. KBS50]
MRIVNRIATLLLSLVLLAAGLVLVIEAARVGFGRPPLVVERNSWYTALRDTQLNATPVRIGVAAATALGLLIVLSQVRRWRPRRLDVPLGPGRWSVSRRSVERRLARAVTGTPGVRHTDVRVVGPSRAGEWRPRIRVAGGPATAAGAQAAARRELDRLGAPPDGLRIDTDRGSRR